MQIRKTISPIVSWAGRLVLLLFLLLLINRSTVGLADPAQKVRRFTSTIEFDFIAWTIDAVGIKLGQSNLGAVEYLDFDQRRQLVINYFELVREQKNLETSIRQMYADPTIDDPEIALEPLQASLDEVQERLSKIQPLAEAVLQQDIAQAVTDMGIARTGLGHPPVAFHFSKPPKALIVSPREVIRQDANVQIEPEYPVQSQIELESQVEEALDVSSLVVQIGGIGTYPTMVMQSDATAWVMETIAHEWIHNYLTLRPLGINYNTSPELRTINETTASLLGKAIGEEVLRQKYPEFLPPPPPTTPPSTSPQEPPAFDFRAEMRETRLNVDAMLEEGKVEEAEQYMENRRHLFWENGYRHIRRLNQAYFAFYGAYADQPGGASGEDPVGNAVRTLWDRIDDPGEFLRRISWVTSFQELLNLVEEVEST